MYQYVSCLLIAGQVKLCSYLRGEKYVKWFTFEHLNWDLCNYSGALEKNKAKYFDISVLVWLSAVTHICILIKKTLLSNWTLHAGKLPKFNSPSLFHLCIRSNGVKKKKHNWPHIIPWKCGNIHLADGWLDML